MDESKQDKPGGASKSDEGEPRLEHGNEPSRQERQVLPTAEAAEEVGGPAGPEPTRYGDWERKGRCIDF